MDGASGGEFAEELSSLRSRVDFLAEAGRAANQPWYKNITTLISVAALVFSLGTTVVAGWHTKDQDTHNLRTELRGILQQLAALPKDNFELSQKYKDDPATFSSLSGLINQQNLILARQADEILRRLPNDQISAEDYISVAGGLSNSRMFDAALVDLNRALAVASPVLDDEIAALRNLASLEMGLGKTGEARAHYQQAADIFGKEPYRGYDQFTKLFTNITTELAWAFSEGSAQNWDLFQQHVSRAEQLVNSLPKGPATDFLRAEVAQLKSGRVGNIQSAFPVPPTSALPGATFPAQK
jgi:tetratricopeptide (TPR) repeat protein